MQKRTGVIFRAFGVLILLQVKSRFEIRDFEIYLLIKQYTVWGVSFKGKRDCSSKYVGFCNKCNFVFELNADFVINVNLLLVRGFRGKRVG